MARKDAELVIRAKDAAAKAIDSVSDALKNLVKTQKEVGASADGTSSTLASLGKALAGLDKQLGGLSVAAKLEKEFTAAQAAAGRLQREVTDLAGKQEKLGTATASAATQISKLRADALTAADALKKQEAAVTAAAGVQNKLAKELKETTAARESLAAADARMVGQIERAQAAVDRTSARVAKLGAELEKAEKPTRTLQKSFADATVSLTTQQAKLDTLGAAYIANRGAIDAAAASVGNLTTKLDAAKNTYTEQNAALAKAKQAVQENAVAIKAAVTNQQALEAEAKGVATALEREQATLKSAQADLGQFAAKSSEAADVQKRMALAIRGGLTDELARQRTALGVTQGAWKEAEGAVKLLATAMKGVEAPSAALKNAFDLSRTAAASAKAEFLATRNNVQLLGTILKDAGGNYEKLAAGQQQFASTQGSVSASFGNVRVAAGGTAAALKVAADATQAAAQANSVLATSTRAPAAGMTEIERASFSLARAFSSITGESRTAMNWFQRLRGEVLALVAAYGGIFGAVQGVKNVIGAVQQLQGAQQRLNVAFEGVPTKTAEELDFIRRNANRLGISFQDLASEYGKFAIATQGTELAGAATRKIFLAVADAARVSKVSADDMKGVFTALTQIVSKGSVQMEELRQQLGDRLPGAIRLMADGLGVSTAELIKMMEAGEVTSNALVNFADRLNKKFGPELAKALLSTETLIGRLQNAATEALITIANSGFIDRFNELIKTLTTSLKSAEADSFFRRLGAAMGVVFDFIGVLIRNFQLLFAAMSALVGIKLAGVIISLQAQFAAMNATVVASRGALGLYAAAVAQTTAQLTLMERAALASGNAFRFLSSSTGLGLAVTAIATAIGFWVTRTEDASVAITKHRDIIEEVKNAYDRAGGNVDTWAKKIEKTTALQIEAAITLEKIVEKNARAKLNSAFIGGFAGEGFFDMFGETKKFLDTFWELKGLFDKGAISATDFKEAVSGIAGESTSQRVKDVALALIKIAEEAGDSKTRIKELEAAYRVITGTSTDLDRATLNLSKSTDAASAAFNTSTVNAKKFEDGLNKLREKIPELAEGMKRLKDNLALDEIIKEMGVPKSIQQMEQLIELREKARLGITLGAIGGKPGTSTDFAANLIGAESGGDASAKNPLSTATGLGQFIESTWLKLFREHFPDRAESMTRETILALRTDAEVSKNMIQLYAAENAKVLQNAGVSVDRAALHLAHFLGPQGAVKVLQAAGDTPLSSILSQGTMDANKFLAGRSAQQLIEWAQKKQNITEQELAVNQQITKEQEKTRKEGEKASEKTDERVKSKQEELKEQQLITDKQKEEAAVQKELAAARKENENVDDERLKQIEEAVRATYRLKNAKEAVNAADKFVDQLTTTRTQLQEQLKLQQASGDSTAADQTRVALQGINVQLQEAISKAIAMWKAIGGPEADAAIAKLKTTSLTIQASAKQTWIDWNRVGEMFASTLTSAFDTFAQAVAKGEDIGKAAREAFLKFASDFLRQVAQMIIRQAILNALRSAFPGMGFGGTPVGVGHEGGLATRLGRQRTVDPAIFANALRYHGGGVPGLKPGEIPAIVQQGEEILQRSDPRNVMNGGGGTGAAPVVNQGSTKIINAIDAGSFLSEAMNSTVGQKVILNFIKANPGAVKQAIGF